MISEQRYLNPPRCRKCGHTICPNVWACVNPNCQKNNVRHRVKAEPDRKEERRSVEWEAKVREAISQSPGDQEAVIYQLLADLEMFREALRGAKRDKCWCRGAFGKHTKSCLTAQALLERPKRTS